MAETVQQVPRQVQNMFNKGFAAFERGNHDVAIDLLGRCLQLSPGFSRARKFMRAAQVRQLQQAGGTGALAAKVRMFKGLLPYLKTAGLLRRGKTDAALVTAEKLLGVDPLNYHFVKRYADAALAAGQIEAAVMTAETAREHAPDHAELSRLMGMLYEKAGNYKAAKECYEKLLALLPEDKDALKLLKDAMARETMGAGWEEAAGKEGSARDLVKDQDETRMLDMKTKAVKTGADIEALIADARAKIEAEPRNLNYYRALARLLIQQKAFEDAIETLEQARKLNPADPELDRSLTQAKLQSFDHRIAGLREAGDTAATEALEQERAQFAFDDLVDRVERYPNDLRLRFELGLQYMEHDAIDDAIQQLQMAQRSPRDRVDALRNLARCFRRKNQNDMALQQLQQAAEAVSGMNDQKKDILYQMGEIAEAAGDNARAVDLYKEIYSVDIGFRDVAEKIEQPPES